MDDLQLRTVWQQRQADDRISPLSAPLGVLMKHTLARRVKQLGKLSQIWDEFVPDEIRDHTALETFTQGVLTVMVDSAAHRFHLQTLLAGGLLRQIQERFPATLSKIRLVPGQFCSVDLGGGPRYYF